MQVSKKNKGIKGIPNFWPNSLIFADQETKSPTGCYRQILIMQNVSMEEKNEKHNSKYNQMLTTI